MGKTGQFKEEMKCEILGIAFVALGVLGIVCLLSPSSGLISQFVDRVLKGLAGEGRYIFPLLLVLAGLRLVFKRSKTRISERMYGAGLLYLVALTSFHLMIPPEDSFKAGIAGDGGGIMGALLSYGFRKSFGITGTYIILITAGVISLLLLTNLSLLAIARGLVERCKTLFKKGLSRMESFLFVDEEEESAREKENNKKDSHPKPVIIDSGERITIMEPTEISTGESLQEKEVQEPPPSSENSPDSAPVSTGQTDFGQDKDRDEEISILEHEKTAGLSSYKLPPLTLLARPNRIKNTRYNKDISENVRILEDTLESFGINAKVIQVSRGPAITRYEIQPPSGVKVSRIVSLADDIALSMAAPGVRIEAPIPGKAAVGIEVPNKEISMVHLRDLLETQEFIQSKSKLTIALGKDIAGNPVIGDLGKMPHLLIAGATGSGKSVCLNTLIASILFKATPDEVKLLMIDPKMVELATYNGIPHLVTPVVTDPRKAATSLRWAVKEMERRYELFAAAGVRDITRYNKLMKTKEPDGNSMPLPFIIVIIDELADLMIVAPADVEDAICRLAQMARAAGMHLVVATQRPSVDVITGLIKANIPSRISFAVSSQIDSRTILDMSGAEKLLGKGDMLFLPVGAAKPIRVQGAYLSDREVEELVKYLKKQAEPVYDEKVLKEAPTEESPPEVEDELLPQAVLILIETGHASISMLQRRLHIGYARAARLIDIMEKRGIVGGYEGSKPRAILMTLEQYNQVFKKRP
ncbi:MAG TPA: DNA translocase FtsK [Bacillota bacterium]|jgi:S-DNA-T family DNA segregation ATPase FtsK/SpoIIIE|nr:DNA translocase FtsK [Peptococcaceae bacterium MAG4]NLW39159.1 DNA translocase FtsK [Peptococcaceae bacterium]HPU35679.1 DNA translocase FtsK [Bacillota bacterium]HQD75115.1 DNA translocase FtsK [Bacillota bacterium]HUM57672.1 DNA translocase FtsK [Bacillota bacterium]